MRGPAARFLGLVLATAGAPTALAGAERYEDGVAFYQRNDFDKSFKALRPLAEKGDARAQYMLGRHYQFGQGVKADRAEAYHWYKRAEIKGNLEAKLFRQLLEKRWKLTAGEKARGERRFAEAAAPRPEKPKAEIAATREPVKPAVTVKPSPPPRAETIRGETPRTETPEKAPPKPPGKPAVAALKYTPPTFSPPATRSAAAEEARAPASDHAASERAAAERTSTRRRPQAETDDGDPEIPNYRQNSPPAETRASLDPPPADYPSDNGYPQTDRPAYAPPGHPSYAQPSYTPNPPYHAPAAPPSWRPQGYHPQPYYAPAWGYRPNRGYVHPGWSSYANPGWRASTSWGPQRGGYRRYRGY